jgi:hypothetical protein
MEKKKNKWYLTKIFEKLIWSFDNSASGFSARKLSAWAAVSVSLYITVHYVAPENLINVLGIWLIFALLCLGIVTAEQIIRFKDGNTPAADDDDAHQQQAHAAQDQNEEDPKL